MIFLAAAITFIAATGWLYGFFAAFLAACAAIAGLWYACAVLEGQE